MLLLSSEWSKGMGLQIWPTIICAVNGFKESKNDTARLISVDSFFPRYGAIFMHPDFPTYISPFLELRDCLHASGEAFDCLRENCRHFRLPGYGLWIAVAGIIRKQLGEERLYRTLIAIQLLVSATSSIVFGVIVKNISNTGYITLWLSSFLHASFPFISRYDSILGTESLYQSFIIFSVWSLYKAQKGHALWSLFSGVLLLQAILIRPIAILLLLIYPLAFFRRSDRIHTVALFFSPFIAFESFWLPCKYYHFKKIIPLTNAIIYPWADDYEWKNVNDFLTSFGDNYYWYYYSAYSLPQRAYTKEFGLAAADSLYQWEKLFYLNSDNKDILAHYETKIVLHLRRWRQAIRNEKPFLYYFFRIFYSTANFLTGHLQESFFYTSPLKAGKIYTAIYLYSALLWISWIGMGLVGSIYYLWKWKKYPFEAILSLSAHYAWSSYVGLGGIESRYFVFPLIFFGLIGLRFGLFLWQRSYLAKVGS